MALTHTIFPGFIPEGYFDPDNVAFIRDKINEVLRRDFTQRIRIPLADIKKVMLRVLGERLEAIPSMNRRVVMYIVAEFREHQGDVDKRLSWLENYRYTQILQDPTEGVSRFDPGAIKLANRLGTPKVGGTARFYFT